MCRQYLSKIVKEDDSKGRNFLLVQNKVGKLLENQFQVDKLDEIKNNLGEKNYDLLVSSIATNMKEDKMDSIVGNVFSKIYGQHENKDNNRPMNKEK